jgi:cytoskeletal protein CcmA (bactofilin family)
MFGKSSIKMDTIIGSDSEFRGALNVKGTVRVDGSMEGDIHADWVIVGETGKVTGNIRSRGVIIGGKVEGNIDASEIVELKNHSQVTGEIRPGKLIVSEGALFVGYSLMDSGKEPAENQDGKVVMIGSPSAAS